MHKIEVDIGMEPESLDVDAASALLVEAIRRTVAAHTPEGEYEVSVLLTDDGHIRELNREYRGKDVPTDVLSFPQTEGEDPESGEGLATLLGDIVISLETAERQAVEYGHAKEREVAFLAVHGSLHLLGFDHEEELDRAEMRLTEEALLSSMGLDRA